MTANANAPGTSRRSLIAAAVLAAPAIIIPDRARAAEIHRDDLTGVFFFDS